MLHSSYNLHKYN